MIDTRIPLQFGLPTTKLSIGKSVTYEADIITLTHGNAWEERMSVIGDWIMFDSNSKDGILEWPNVHEYSRVWIIPADEFHPGITHPVAHTFAGNDIKTSLYCPVKIPIDAAVYLITEFEQPGTHARYCSLMRWVVEPYGMEGIMSLVQAEAFGMQMRGEEQFRWIIGAGHTKDNRAVPTDFGRIIVNHIDPPQSMAEVIHWYPAPVVTYTGGR